MESIINYNLFHKNKYLEYLSLVGALSGLFSDSEIPLLHYRATENIYCGVFKAENLSRADISADAKYNGYGIGIKTFIENNKKTLQKVAEFNQESSLFASLEDEEKIRKIADLRNNRLDFAKSAYNIDELVYHCIVRNSKGLHLYEEKMDNIDVSNIIIDKKGDSSIQFNDGLNEYNFYKTKSTLFKRFYTRDYFASVPVNILENPISLLEKLDIVIGEPQIVQTVVLPLYSHKNYEKHVYEKSGLNQWNAGGRERNQDEVYIPHPKEIRDEFDTFFPDRKTPFEVLLPDGSKIKMKVCQESGKAIMSDPNKILGKWLLRDILKIPYGTLVNYETLLKIGIDCVVFEKTGNTYKMDFKAVGEYEKFLKRHEI
ncbi:NgoFVII family restriction endonuclease [Clostridioides mangenotii]|uniref:restriction endonuclease PLD domain-containing protein n=1 Tax=Metaclostridioides mangenotii TaxID=1540 RepID=UPI002149DA56|nr:restriction endonuclease PLD domain-containing protein [Clostridioides mangenotii]MCR1955234.1 NgoFVII family restriction endonuclease [Clostridioides mangenotii]